MLSMNKIVAFILIFLFISSLFTTVFSSVSASELVKDTWNTKASMNQARAGLVVVAVDGKIYAIGGITDDGFVWTNERYDLKTDKWVTLKPMPTPKANFAIVNYHGEIYCIGGESKEGVYSGVEVYNVATDSWSTKKDISFDGRGIQAHDADGKIFAVKKQNFSWEAGYSSFASDLLYLYDLSTDEWPQKDIPYTDWVATGSALVNSVSVTMGDKIMIYFKYIEPGNLWYDIFDIAMIYDPETNTWSEAITPPNYLGFPASTLGWVFGSGMTSGIYAPKNIYFFQEKRTTVYDPVKTTWSDRASMSESRKDFGVAIVDNVFYAIGGSTSLGICFTNEQYVPLGYVPVSPVPSELLVTSKPEPSTPSLTYFDVAILAIIIVTVAVGLIVYFKKKKQRV